MLKKVRALTFLGRTLVQFHHPHQETPNPPNNSSSSRRSSALFWPFPALHKLSNYIHNMIKHEEKILSRGAGEVAQQLGGSAALEDDSVRFLAPT